MDNATLWCELREVWLKVGELAPKDFQERLISLMDDVKPTLVPDSGAGDFGYVYFEDESAVKWDWGMGDFECDGVRYSYPYTCDPLFWL